jgi:hypothetical protein
MSLLVALIWVACFCGAVRDYRGVTVSFLVGLPWRLSAAPPLPPQTTARPAWRRFMLGPLTFSA